MIYDSERVERLIEQWREGDEEAEEQILLESVPLVEVIVSRYDRTLREDMIQECLIKISKALKYFDPSVANAHKYFTSVITNRCNDFINKQNRQLHIRERLQLHPETYTYDVIPPAQEHLLHELKERNRLRFPSMQVDELDAATEFIFRSMLEGIYGKSRGAIKELTSKYNLNRREATVIYHSSLVWLRHKYSKEARSECEEPKEISLLPDLREIIGEEAYEHLALVMSGMYIKFP